MHPRTPTAQVDSPIVGGRALLLDEQQGHFQESNAPLSLPDSSVAKHPPSVNKPDTTSEPYEELVRRIAYNIAHDKARLQSARRTRHQLYKQQDARRDFERPRLREILELLEDSTPTDQTWLEKAFRLLVPRASAVQLLQGVDDTIWEIAAEHNCSVEPAYVGIPKEEQIPFLLSGPALSLKRVLTDIRRLYPDVLFVLSETLTSKQRDTSLMADSWARTKGQPHDRGGEVRNVFVTHYQPLAVQGADRIPPPVVWNPRTFVDYVQNLTIMEARHSGGQDQVQVVTRRLDALFSQSNARSSISRTAFNMALQYLIKHNRIQDARILYTRMDLVGLPMSTETFNIMLRRTAQMEDHHVTSYILRLMLKKGFLPNAGTWIALLMANHNPSTAIAVVNVMMRKGLLRNVETLRAVIEHIVRYEVNASIDHGKGMPQFLLHMRDRYGAKWLNADISHRILDALGSRGLISRCREFLEEMVSSFVPIERVAINIVLTHCKRTMNVAGAVNFLQGLPPSMQVVPDRYTFHLLFESAWSTKHYNIAKVVWKYACFSGCTTPRMRTIIRDSLRTESKWFKPSLCVPAAALFVTGVNETSPYGDICLSELIQEHVTSALKLKGDVNRRALPGRRNHQRRMVQRYMLREYDLFGKKNPNGPLVSMLVKAFFIDQQWGVCIEDPLSLDQLDEMLSQGIQLVDQKREPWQRLAVHDEVEVTAPQDGADVTRRVSERMQIEVGVPGAVPDKAGMRTVRRVSID